MDKLFTLIIIGLFGVVVGGAAVLVTQPAPIVPAPQLGALAGPDIASPYLRWGDQVTFKAHVPLLTENNATTTLCNILSPAATSTLTSASVQLDTSTTSAMQIEIAKSTAPDATTTLIGTMSKLAANSRETLVASTTPTGGKLTIFAPNTWFVVKAGPSSAGSLGVAGSCNATFEVN